MSILRKNRILGILVLSLMMVLAFGSVAKADSPLSAYLFYGDGCPHCAKEEAFFKKILPNYPNLKLNSYETWYNKQNVNLMQRVADKLDVEANGVPFLVIGDKEFVGFLEGTTEAEIISQIETCINSDCPDSIASLINSSNSQEGTEIALATKEDVKAGSNEEKIVRLPFIGKINALDFSLPIFTIIMGGLDGFNPCAMWTLLFLISLLLGFKDRRKMWILGGVFILTSALTYSLFMVAWLKLIIFLGLVIWVRLAIGGIALIGGGYNIKKGITNKDGGCEIAGDEKRQVVFKRLREITKSKSFILALGGIVVLAFAVNLVELVCSAGLPAIYTQVLSMSNLSSWQYFGYILLYILFFMLDDIIIFSIAMITLRMTGISTKYSKWSSLIGGILMVIIGLLLIFRPEWLMFG